MSSPSSATVAASATDTAACGSSCSSRTSRVDASDLAIRAWKLTTTTPNIVYAFVSSSFFLRATSSASVVVYATAIVIVIRVIDFAVFSCSDDTPAGQFITFSDLTGRGIAAAHVRSAPSAHIGRDHV